MKTITINARNTSREFAAADLDTVTTILAHVDVRNLFGFEDDETAVSTLIEHVTDIKNGSEEYNLRNMSEGFKRAILNAALEDGATIDVDYYAVEDDTGAAVDAANDAQDEDDEDEDQDPFDDDDEDFDDEDEDEGDDDEEDEDDEDDEEEHQTTAGEPRHGIVKVNTNGGMIETKVEIIDGVTTVMEAIYSDPVKARSAMDETAISNCSVILNGDVLSPNNIGTRKLKSGDTIDLTPRFTALKG